MSVVVGRIEIAPGSSAPMATLDLQGLTIQSWDNRNIDDERPCYNETTFHG